MAPRSLDEALDLYAIKRTLERVNESVDLGRASADLSFLRHARSALLPLPVIDRPAAVEPDVLGPLRRRPIPALKGKRIALIASGGGGACVSLIGIRRAFEEAGAEPALISACSGGAIWGSMWAAGMSARDMERFSLSWRPADYLDIQWAKLPRFLLSALRGFSGLAKGEAIEHLFNERLWRLPAGEMPIELQTIVYNMDLGLVQYLGSRATPEVTVGEFVRIAIALPLFIESVLVRGHRYVDGGIVELFPAEPVLAAEEEFDLVFGANFMLPHGFEPEDITGWVERPMGILQASRQLQQGYHLEFARRAREALGDRLVLIEPVEPALTRGVSFYDLFIDNRRWPELIRRGHQSARAALEGLRRAPAQHDTVEVHP